MMPVNHLYKLTYIFLLALCIIPTFNGNAEMVGSTTSYPPIPDSSSFDCELLSLEGKQIAAPSTKKQITWDFRQKRKLKYEYIKKSIVHDYISNQGRRPDREPVEMHINGTLMIESFGNETADVSIEIVESKLSKGIKDDSKDGPDVDFNFPGIKTRGVNEDGSIKNQENGKEPHIGVLFPLPGKILKLGESVTIDETLSIPIDDKKIELVGKIVVFLSDYVRIEENDCARFEADIAFKNKVIGDAVGEKFVFSQKGKSTYYYDLANKNLLKGKSAMVTSVRFDGSSINGKSTDTQNKIMKMMIDNDDFVSIHLIDNKRVGGEP